MSNKFTGITSAGSAIPVYDKDAHSALGQKLDTSAFSSVSGEFATVDDVVAAVSGKADTSAIPSLDGYATQEWVGEQGYLTEVPAGYATTEDVISATSGLQPSGDYLSASESANFYPMTGNPSGFLTEHQSLDGLMETSGLEYDGDKISGYLGSAFAGGGEVPEGVMVESAVEYNAVNEISGYNGSAIAQYGAEKQWLVHDDTLVHAANSAQYALGVNLSALQRLMGIDETVLWSGSANAASFPITLSEPASAFNEIKFTWTPRYQGDYGCPTVVEIQNTNPHNGTIKYTLMHAYWNANEPWLGAWYLTPTDNFTKIASEKNAFCNMTKTAQSMSDGLNCFMWEIRGIGRKH